MSKKGWTSRASSMFKHRRRSGDQDSHFDDEARELFAQLNLEVKKGVSASTNSRYNNLDAVYKDPIGGGQVFIGNATAAQSRDILEANNITHIVNCTADMKCFLADDPKFHYKRFQITYWFQDKRTKASKTGALDFCQEIFQWIDDAIARGESCLIHCLAGAHRAGTTGTLYVMHVTGMDLRSALKLVKSIRPVVNPIGLLKQLAAKYDEQQRVHGVRKSKPVESKEKEESTPSSRDSLEGKEEKSRSLEKKAVSAHVPSPSMDAEAQAGASIA